MNVIITSTDDKQDFKKPIINIGTNPKCDFFIGNLNYDLIFSVQYNNENNTYQVTNNFKNQNILYKGEVLQKAVIKDGICRITFKDSEEFVEIKLGNDFSHTDSGERISLSEDELKALYGEDALSDVKVKIEQAREPIEQARVAIIKQIAYPISELKSKIKTNWRTNLILHIALFLSSILNSFALANYLMGLSIQESAKHVYLSTNIQAWAAFTFIVFAISLMLKQGVYLYFNEKTTANNSISSKIAKHFMLWISSIFIIGIYTVNLAYFSAISEFLAFAMFITFFFTGAMSALAIACGYFKANGASFSQVLNKYEFREDFESVLKTYRIWIERYVNCLSSTKINTIKDRLFMLQLKASGEIIIGILTAPFLAYGVSNTLAMCFPEAAGWIRISGLRFSPIFLVLATFLIIFAFFAFVNAFVAERKIQASQVIKQDGFSDYRHHGISIYGLEGTKKLDSDKKLFLCIACSIVFIEFMMNVSYFMTEIGGEIKGVFMSFIAALVPTALLIAETMMLAATRFDIHACDELLSKLDKE